MKSAKLFLLFLSILILNSCAHKVKIDAVVAPDQMIDDQGVVTSEMKHVVSLSYYDKFGMFDGKTMFMIIVENYGTKPIDISNDNISVMFEGNSKDWASKEVNLETPFEVMRDVQKEMMNRARRMSSRRNSDFSDITSGSSGGGSGGGGGSTGISQSLQMESMQIRQDRMRQMRTQSFYSLPRIIIKPQIIMPNDSISGIFVCDTSEMKKKLQGNFKITVTIDGEEHRFTFTRS